MAETILKREEGCYACAVRCKRSVEILSGPYATARQYGGPEYETLSSLGSLLCIDDLAAIAKGNELCNRYTLDTISTGVAIGFAMECLREGHPDPGRYGRDRLHLREPRGDVEGDRMDRFPQAGIGRSSGRRRQDRRGEDRQGFGKVRPPYQRAGASHARPAREDRPGAELCRIADGRGPCESPP